MEAPGEIVFLAEAFDILQRDTLSIFASTSAPMLEAEVRPTAYTPL